MTDTTLSKAYKLAKRLKELAPWNYMKESDIFGVKMPDDGKTYFISIMGSGGEHFGMSAYEDVVGLVGFREIQLPAEWIRPLELMLIPHMMVSFNDRDSTEPQVRKKIKELGFVFRGQNDWPDFRQIIPGFVPIMPDEVNLGRLIIIMEQAINVLERADSNLELIYPSNTDADSFLVRTTSGSVSEPSQWADTYQTFKAPVFNYELQYNTLERDKIKTLRSSKDVLQADIAMLSNPVAEPGKNAFFASVFIVMSKKTGKVLDFETLTPQKGINAMHARFPDLLIKAILKQKWRPTAIEIRHPIFYQMAKTTLGPINLKIIHKPITRQIDRFLNMFESGF